MHRWTVIYCNQRWTVLAAFYRHQRWTSSVILVYRMWVLCRPYDHATRRPRSHPGSTSLGAHYDMRTSMWHALHAPPGRLEQQLIEQQGSLYRDSNADSNSVSAARQTDGKGEL